jgi:predicted RNA polymerase sigma factor
LSFSWKGDCLREEGHLQEAKECYDRAYQLTHSAVYLKEKERMEDLIHNQEEKK